MHISIQEDRVPWTASHTLNQKGRWIRAPGSSRGVSVLLVVVGVSSVGLFWHPWFFITVDIRLEAVKIEGYYRKPNISNPQLVMRMQVVSMLVSKIMPLFKMPFKQKWACTWKDQWEGVWGRMDTRNVHDWVLCCPPETLTTLLISYAPIQNKV